MSNIKLAITPAEACTLPGASGFLMSPAAVRSQGTSLPVASSLKGGFGTGGGFAVATRVRPRPQALQVKGHGQPATNQHIYNYNPAVDGVAVSAAGPPQRRAPV